LGIIQLGTFPVAIITIIYAWGSLSTGTATIFTIWMIIVSVSDNILKPILLGKGAPVPMLVVFLGAIGGFILSGFIGLFTGAVVLSLGYKLFEAWLNETSI
jgi:predicted PurR-regulated permease PerM